MSKYHHSTPTFDHEDVIEVGLDHFIVDHTNDDADLNIDVHSRNHGTKLIEALEESLDDSISPLDRLQKLRLSGEARHVLDMELTK